MRYALEPIDKPALLVAAMRAFQGEASYIALEGDLSSYHLQSLQNAASQETDALKRQTESPLMDFVVAQLTAINITVISRAIARKDGLAKESGLIHVQISKNGQLVFGGYDNFHRDCVFVDGMSERELAKLKAQRILRGFEGVTDA